LRKSCLNENGRQSSRPFLFGRGLSYSPAHSGLLSGQSHRSPPEASATQPSYPTEGTTLGEIADVPVVGFVGTDGTRQNFQPVVVIGLGAGGLDAAAGVSQDSERTNVVEVYHGDATDVEERGRRTGTFLDRGSLSRNSRLKDTERGGLGYCCGWDGTGYDQSGLRSAVDGGRGGGRLSLKWFGERGGGR